MQISLNSRIRLSQKDDGIKEQLKKKYKERLTLVLKSKLNGRN